MAQGSGGASHRSTVATPGGNVAAVENTALNADSITFVLAGRRAHLYSACR
jgi:hypothetical protein